MSKYYLVSSQGERKFQLTPDQPLILGRNEEFGITDKRCSRKQLQVEPKQDFVELTTVICHTKFNLTIVKVGSQSFGHRNESER